MCSPLNQSKFRDLTMTPKRLFLNQSKVRFINIDSPNELLMTGPRTDAQLTGGSATSDPVTKAIRTLLITGLEKFKCGPEEREISAS